MNKSLFPCMLCVSLLGCQASIDSDGREADGNDRAEMPTSLHEPGQYGLHVIDLVEIPGSAAGRIVDATVCAPADPTGEISDDGPFPLVIMSPGARTSREQYMSYCEHLATWGFVVISQSIIGNDGWFPPVNHKRPAADVSAIIDWATSEQNAFAGAIDANAIGVAGHSMGGKVSFLAAAQDPRIGAIVGWDPVDANGPFTPSSSPDWSSATPELMPNLTLPIAVIGETVNSQGNFFSPACAPSEHNFEQYYEFAETTSLLVEVFDADHMDWTDSGSCWPCSPCGPNDVQPLAQQITRSLTTAWFLRHLAGDESVDPQSELQPQIDAGQILVQAK
ncbi:MAG: CocE/NonD family hydrolase [Myxococcota bacterium]